MRGLCFKAFSDATCMTDSIAALSCLSSLPGKEKDEALAKFYENAKGDQLVLNKWFTIQVPKHLFVCLGGRSR